MTTNPFQPPCEIATTGPAPHRRTWPWVLVLVGPALVIGGVAAPLLVMMAGFDEIANSPRPSPSDLAGNISTAVLVAIVGIPVALLGVTLVVVGIVLLLRPGDQCTVGASAASDRTGEPTP